MILTRSKKFLVKKKMSSIVSSTLSTLNNLIPKTNQYYIMSALALFVTAWVIISFIASAATKKRYADADQGLGSAAPPSDSSLAADAKADYDRNLVLMTTVLPLCIFGFLISAPFVLLDLFKS